MKNLIFFFLLLLIATGGFAQNCDLTEDRTDAYGNILRGAEWTYTDASGTTVNLMLDRTKDRYTFVFNLHQPKENAVKFTLDGEVHPVIFVLSNGGSVNAWTSENRAFESQDNGSSITFSEQYKLQNSELRSFDNARVTAIAFKCSGRSLATGNAVNEIRFALNTTEGEALSNAFRCLQKDPEPIALKPAPKPRASVQSATTGNAVQEDLMRQLIHVVGEGTDGIKASVEQSGTTQMEQNLMMMEKLEGLSAAIEQLNETKKDEEFVPRVFGFGVYFKTNYLFGETQITTETTNEEFDGTNLSFGDYSAANRFMNGTSLNMSFNAGMRKKVGFRIEPFVDFVVFSSKTDGDNTTVQSSARQIETGLRLLLIVRKGRVNIYPGITGGFVNQFRSQKITIKNSGSWNSGQGSRNGGNIGLVLGGEYLLTPHFGVRVESGLLYYILGQTKVSSKASDGSSSSTPLKYTSGLFGSYARLGCSFYF